MKIYNVSQGELEIALRKTNELFDHNIIFRDISWKNKYGYWNVTLQVKDSSGAGARGSPTRTRNDGEPYRTINACYHAHGVFIDKLGEVNSEMRIFSSWAPESWIYVVGDQVVNNWQEIPYETRNGTIYISNLCECD